MGNRYFATKIVLISWFLMFSSITNSRLDHACAYSNESVVKFRGKIIGKSMANAYKSCLADQILSQNKPIFDWPVDLCKFWVSSLFGPRTHQGVTKKHGGVDMAADQGTDVRASAPGTIIRVEQGVLGYGTVIEIQHIGGFMTRYGHLATVLVQQGQKVERAEVIGTVGSTGNVRGKGDPSHLHFEVVQSGKRLDPLRYLYCAEVAFQKS